MAAVFGTSTKRDSYEKQQAYLDFIPALEIQRPEPCRVVVFNRGGGASVGSGKRTVRGVLPGKNQEDQKYADELHQHHEKDHERMRPLRIGAVAGSR